MGRTVEKWIYRFDAGNPRLGDYTLPYHPLFVLVNHFFQSDWAGSRSYPHAVRALRDNYLTYPLYVLDCLDANATGSTIDVKLNDWKIADGTTLGNMFIVLMAKFILYSATTHRAYLTRLVTESRRYLVYKAAEQEVLHKDIARKLCAYLGVTYLAYPHTSSHNHCYAAPPVEDALYSLSYALWYNKDGAREKVKMTHDYIKGFSSQIDLFDGLCDAFDAYASAFRVERHFERMR